MHRANVSIAQQRILEAQQEACEARLVRLSRAGRPPRTLLDRLRGARR